MSFVLLLLIFLCCHALPLPGLADPRATEAALVCTNRTVPDPMSEFPFFISNFWDALDSLTPLMHTQRYAAVVNGTQNSTVYAFGECMKDLNQPDCDVCFSQCKTQVLRCVPLQRSIRGGKFFFDGCYLRYDDYDFFNESVSLQDKTVCGTSNFSGNSDVYKANALELVRNLSMEAPRNDGFFVGSVSRRNVTIYGLAQCWKFVNGSACQNCLEDAVTRIGSCTPKEEGRALNAGCYLRYSTQMFYNSNTSSNNDPGENQVRSNSQPLKWEVRHKIILGTAEGLAYLHEESQMRIIHRDIKLSNILLDENFTPKIADFGLVRLFPEDKSHISTTIAGTLGYMAPEYVVLGKLTEKADVYSFGVLVIEIMSGTCIRSIVQNSISILHTVWNLYESNTLCDIVDPILEGNYPAEEACKLLKIGLLCTQASSELRPSMSEVVEMITNDNEITQPTQPPFLSRRSTECSISTSPKDSFQPGPHSQSSEDSMTESLIEPLHPKSEHFSAQNHI